MKSAFKPRSPKWFSRVALVVFVLGSLALLSFIAWRSWEDERHLGMRDDVSLARSLEHDVTQSLHVVRVLAQNLNLEAHGLTPAGSEQAALLRDLNHLIAPFSFIRSLSLADSKGRILLSTLSANVGLYVDRAQFLPAPPDDLPAPIDAYEGYRIGPPIPGRDWVGASLKLGEAPPKLDRNTPLYFLPMALDVAAGGQPLMLVLTVNPDHFVTNFAQRLEHAGAKAQLIRADGLLLASSAPTDGIASPVDAALSGRFETKDYDLVEALPDPAYRHVSYRVSSKFPLALAVYAHKDQLWGSWWQAAGHQMLVLSPILLLLAGAGFGVWRAKGRMADAHLRLVQTNEQALEGLVQQRTNDLEHKHTELTQAMRRLRGLVASFNNLTVAIFIKDAQGRYLECNLAFEEFINKRREQIIGYTVFDVMEPERATRNHTADMELIMEGGSRSYEVQAMTPHGMRELLVHKALFLDDTGVPMGVSGAIFDMTDLNRTKRDLAQAAQAAQQASKTKSEFLAVMSHELRTPMAGVIGMLGLTLKSDLKAQQREQVTLARHNAENLLTIVNDLLDISKIEAGKLDLEHIDFALRPMIEDAMQLLRERAAQKNLIFELDLDPTLAPFVQGDPTRLRQILINLVGNALKFTEDGNVRLQVRALSQAPKELAGGSHAQQPWARFAVSDTGIGMSEEARARMFQKFEQADTSTTRKFGGTGLGLSICKMLVELMGGQIRVDSELGRGSTFWFDVPVPLGQEPQEALEYKLAPHDYQLRVLVAEDAYTNQVIIQAMLEDLGHVATLVENGELALQALAVSHFDLVLMDGRMPVMDGIEATAHVRDGEWKDLIFLNPNIPIYALTANAGAQDREAFLRCGMQEVLTKPIDEVTLHKTLEAVIQKRLAKGLPMSPRGRSHEISQEVPAEVSTSVVSAAEALAALDQFLGFTQQEDGAQDVAAQAPVSQPPVTQAPAPEARSEKAAALRARMVAAFAQQAPLKLQEIDAAVAAGDWNLAAITAHGIKGSLAYLWPESELFRLAAQMEAWADALEVHAFQEGLARLKSGLAALELV